MKLTSLMLAELEMKINRIDYISSDNVGGGEAGQEAPGCSALTTVTGRPLARSARCGRS
jgi:hypothetical protein